MAAQMPPVHLAGRHLLKSIDGTGVMRIVLHASLHYFFVFPFFNPNSVHLLLCERIIVAVPIFILLLFLSCPLCRVVPKTFETVGIALNKIQELSQSI